MRWPLGRPKSFFSSKIKIIKNDLKVLSRGADEGRDSATELEFPFDEFDISHLLVFERVFGLHRHSHLSTAATLRCPDRKYISHFMHKWFTNDISSYLYVHVFIQKFITLNIQASLLINSYMDLLTRREIWSVTEKFCASFEEWTSTSFHLWHAYF